MSTRQWNELFNLKLDDWGLTFQLGPVLLCLLVLMVVAYVAFVLWRKGWKFWKGWEAVSAEIPIGNLGTVTIHPNHETVKVAYKAWIELATRKAALPFDEEHDVIVEVYNSWYQLFERLRNLAKEIPAHQLRKNKDARELVHVMVVVLNEGLRPHLTKWQAKFRRWYEAECKKESCLNLSPQEIQRKYPEYEALVNDIKNVNNAIVKYAKLLRKVAEGDKENS